MTEFWCDIPCVPCRKAKECHKISSPPILKGGGIWYPSQAPDVLLPCGCVGVAWFIWHVLGEDVISITCDLHGPQTLSKNWREKARIAAKKEHAAYLKRCERASTMTLEELNKIDPPPF